VAFEEPFPYVIVETDQRDLVTEHRAGSVEHSWRDQTSAGVVVGRDD
jgi:hypothetical protein